MITFRDLVNGFREIGLAANRPVIVHCALSSFGMEVRGGAETVLGALLTVTGRVMAPTFTYKTWIVPEDGPADNAYSYGSGKDTNQMAEFYNPSMPADKMMGAFAETLRRHPQARRSMHPGLSFAGVGVDSALEAQTLAEPLAPIRMLSEAGGDVLLVGVDQTVNTSIHYAESVAGRKQFIRWALTPKGVVQFPGSPGCSDGFNQAEPYLAEFTRRTRIGQAAVQAIALGPLVETIVRLLQEQPLALLCERNECERCDAVRQAVSPSPLPPSSGEGGN
jgi:aminoglycoside 3-N-acetyltransferase